MNTKPIFSAAVSISLLLAGGAAGAVDYPPTRPFVISGMSAKAVPSAKLPTAPTGAEAVGKLLQPQQADPSVPLPHPDLAERASEAPESLDKPTIYGRREDGGGVVGFRVPIPADRSAGK